MDNQIQSSNSGVNTGKMVMTAVGVLLIILLVVWFMKKDKTETATENIQPNQTNTNPGEQPSIQPNTTVSRKYADGSYSAIGNYVSPAGAEEIALTITVKDDVIVSAEFTGKGTHPTTQFMQGKFKAGFSEVVVGKSVDSVNLTVVNGSSLTPKGFMEALNKIKGEAKS